MQSKKKFVAPEQINKILSATDIVQIINEYLPLKPSGKNFVACCPFHNEKTPSFIVSSSRQNYHCYGCGAHGNAIRFLMDHENYAFFDALEILAKKAGIELVHSAHKNTQNKSDQNLLDCLNVTCEFYQDQLRAAMRNKNLAWQYLQNREISISSIKTFKIGLALDEWSALNEFLEKNNFSHITQEKVGLIKNNSHGGYYDRLRNRIIFPVRNINGNLLGFSGRSVNNEEPKYLNPPETILYKKSSIFYGIFEAKEFIRKKSRVFIVEGYLDVIRMHENEFQETIATCGTALTLEHINVLKKLHINQIYLVFDGDHAGIKAAEKSARLFIEANIDSHVIILPNQMDPDDYFKKYTATNFEHEVQNAKYDYQFIIEQAFKSCSGHGITMQKKVIQDLLDLAGKISDRIQNDLFITIIGKTFEIDKKNLLQNNHSSITFKSLNTSQEVPQKCFAFDPSHAREVDIVQYIIIHLSAIVIIREYIAPNEFTHNQLRNLYQRFLNLENHEFLKLSSQNLSDFFNEYSELISYLSQKGNKYRLQNFSEQQVESLIYKFKKQKYDELLQKMKLARNHKDSKNELETLKERKEILAKISHLHHRQ